MSAASEIPRTVEQLAEHVVHLQECLESLRAEVEQKDEQIEQQDEQIAELEEQVADQEERIADLEARGEAATRKRNHLAEELERVEETAEAAVSAPTDTGAEAEDPEPSADAAVPQTPLEQVVGLPEHLADEELTANQERARFIAQDVRDYAEKVPAGYAIPSTDLRKILKAREGSTPHTQTVARVMDFLEELGGEGTTLIERRRTNRIAFSEEAVERLQEQAARARATGDAEAPGPDESITPVVMGGG